VVAVHRPLRDERAGVTQQVAPAPVRVRKERRLHDSALVLQRQKDHRLAMLRHLVPARDGDPGRAQPAPRRGVGDRRGGTQAGGQVRAVERQRVSLAHDPEMLELPGQTLLGGGRRELGDAVLVAAGDQR
jgi:hypothetical protein